MLNIDDPLIAVPIDLESYIAQSGTTDFLADFGRLVSEYLTEVVVQMPAFDTVGTVLVPPDEHVLDHLARAWDLVDAAEANVRPRAGTVACPVEHLDCDLCGARARYETPVRSGGDRILIYACLDCMREHGDPMLGAGDSVYLMYFDEVPTAVRTVCDEIRDRQGQGSIWAPDDEQAGTPS